MHPRTPLLAFWGPCALYPPLPTSGSLPSPEALLGAPAQLLRRMSSSQPSLGCRCLWLGHGCGVAAPRLGLATVRPVLFLFTFGDTQGQDGGAVGAHWVMLGLPDAERAEYCVNFRRGLYAHSRIAVPLVVIFSADGGAVSRASGTQRTDRRLFGSPSRARRCAYSPLPLARWLAVAARVDALGAVVSRLSR